MLYKRLDRKRRSYSEEDDRDSDRYQKRNGRNRNSRGLRFTFLSFFVMGACLLFIKIANPDIPLRQPVLMLVCTCLACVIMSYISGRPK
jgi:hypothetical protein